MLNNHLLGLYEKALPVDMNWKSRLEAAKELGFDFMEISIDEKDERLERLYWSDEEKYAFLKIIKKSGIDIRSMCLSGHRRFPFGSSDPVAKEKAYEIMKLGIDFADYMGIKIIQLAGYDVYYEKSTEDSRKAFLEGLKWSCGYAARRNVMLAMEIMDTPFLNSITKNLWYEDKLHSSWYKVYPDLGNLTAWGNDVAEELIKGIDSIVAVHLKDTLAVTEDFPGKFKCVPFGSGCVDFASAFEVLESKGYQGHFMIEMWTDSRQDDIAEIIKAKKFIEEKYEEGVSRIDNRIL